MPSLATPRFSGSLLSVFSPLTQSPSRPHESQSRPVPSLSSDPRYLSCVSAPAELWTSSLSPCVAPISHSSVSLPDSTAANPLQSDPASPSRGWAEGEQGGSASRPPGQGSRFWRNSLSCSSQASGGGQVTERSNLSVLEQKPNVPSFFQESDFSHCGPKGHLHIENCFRIYVYLFFIQIFFFIPMCT